VRARLRRQRRAQLHRHPHHVGEAQGAALKGRLDELRRNAGAVEMRLRLVQVLLVEHVHADALAARLAVRLLQGEAMVSALLDAVQVDRIGILVADDQAHHFGVERAARGQVLRGQHEMARPRDVERRIKIGRRDRHRNSPLSQTGSADR
jgi:hypothetical protein